MNFLDGSFRVGRLFEVEIRVHILLIIWIAFRAYQIGDIPFALAYSAMLFGIILCHEFGHCFGARSVGGNADQILMWPLGGLAFAHAPMRAWPQFVTVACGPLVNVLFCALAAGVLFAVNGTLQGLSLSPLGYSRIPYTAPSWAVYVALFYDVNLWLLAFNLLPVYPMDGGQLLQTILWPWMGLQRSMILACQIGVGGAFVFGILGIQTSSTILVCIAIFGAMTCLQRLRAARAGFLLEDDRFVIHRPHRPDAGFWSRLFARRPRTPRADRPEKLNPNPGAWESRIEGERFLEAEVDRILQKVHDQGINSLSYTERQTLERATRRRQEREREHQRSSRS